MKQVEIFITSNRRALNFNDVLECLSMSWPRAFNEANNAMAWKLPGLYPFTAAPYWKQLAAESKTKKRRAAAASEPALSSEVNWGALTLPTFGRGNDDTDDADPLENVKVARLTSGDLQHVGGAANSEAGLKRAFFKTEIGKIKTAKKDELTSACAKFNLTYKSADQAKVDLIRALEKQNNDRVPLAWIPASLQPKFTGRDVSEATNPKKKQKQGFPIGEGANIATQLSAKYHINATTPSRVILGQIDLNQAQQP
mmetsp:Transcript_14762/g.48238  ORF Transcript_14762/g.48238 Transcript_14762/m.48238 type:complete len:255 (+) Transcript_14762:557-1321(+)